MSGVEPAAGEQLFARFAYPPNVLGYCGTGDGAQLLGLASGTGPPSSPGVEGLTPTARRFDGAWPYLEIIAGADPERRRPLDEHVVEAYWLGNDLLEAVDPVAFSAQVRERFASQSGADWLCLGSTGARPPLPHHSFHVLAIYPWMGLLRRGTPGPALTVLDRCRIRWGEVLGVTDETVQVRFQPLAWDGRYLGLGPSAIESARWSDRGRSLSRTVSTGDWVALHWDWVCDTLSADRLAALQHYTARQIEATNAASMG